MLKIKMNTPESNGMFINAWKLKYQYLFTFPRYQYCKIHHISPNTSSLAKGFWFMESGVDQKTLASKDAPNIVKYII